MIFIDSNVLIDIFVGEGQWSDWSGAALAGADDTLVINRIILAEISPRFAALPILDGFLQTIGIVKLEMNDAAAFRAGRAHAAYRRAGGKRESILADFLIGAHALALDAKLLTRDRHRFATYFPELELIAPETDHG